MRTKKSRAKPLRVLPGIRPATSRSLNDGLSAVTKPAERAYSDKRKLNTIFTGSATLTVPNIMTGGLMP